MILHEHAPEIWIADDSPLDLENARRILSNRYPIKTFADGPQVLEQLSKGSRPAVLVLDWIMPEMSGPEVIRFLRGQPSGGELQILLLTAHRKTDEIVEGLAAGANDYVAKPYAPEELLARVDALVRMRALTDRLKRTEAELRSTLANAPDALLEIDAQGKITFANQEACRVLECREDALCGAPLLSALPGLASSSISAGAGGTLLPTKDLELNGRVFAPTMRPLPREGSSRTSIALRDVTEERRAETRRLDFYSIIAHDLRTPLSALMLRTQLIQSGRRGLISSELRSDVQKMERSLRALISMSNDFLELARLEGVGYKVAREEVELLRIIRATLEDFRPLADAGRVTLHLSGFSGEALVLGDAQRLTQVVANLVGNAIKFTPAGGRIEVDVVDRDRDVEVRIRDNGKGISSELIPALFQRYNRALDDSQGIPGTGLGLMIVREIVEAHDGTVGVESKAGEGSTFWFRMPRVESSAAERHPQAN
jgi:two-component system phosphate regulon sensor histidine kinase PhoR